MKIKNLKVKFFIDVVVSTISVYLLIVPVDLLLEKLEEYELPLIDFITDDQNVWWVQDYVYSQKSRDIEPEDDIYLVNIGMVDRAKIAQIIDSVSKYEPRVLGLDFFLRKHKAYDLDSALIA